MEKEEIIVLLIMVLGFGAMIWFINEDYKYEKAHPCLEYKTEEYYDSTGTSLWITTGNVGFLTMNGMKEHQVCVKRQ